jgi:hypothetical protein
MKDTLSHIASTLNYAGFREAELRQALPKSTKCPNRKGWFRRGLGGVIVFITASAGRTQRIIVDLYDVKGHRACREYCEDAIRAANKAESLLHLRSMA